LYQAQIVHELRTPINSSMSFLESLEDLIQPKDIELYLEPAQLCLKLLLNLINDILDFTQIQFGQFKYTFDLVHLDELLNECLYFFKYRSQLKKILLTLKMESTNSRESWTLVSDQDRIR
jgi:signal transduction histidine kinase